MVSTSSIMQMEPKPPCIDRKLKPSTPLKVCLQSISTLLTLKITHKYYRSFSLKQIPCAEEVAHQIYLFQPPQILNSKQIYDLINFPKHYRVIITTRHPHHQYHQFHQLFLQYRLHRHHLHRPLVNKLVNWIILI